MANVAHSTLTTTDLHEPKDIAGASAGEVYIADGAASGAMAANPPLVAIYQYQETDGTNGEAYTASWAAVNLNTEVADVGGIGSIATKAVTLQAGTYVLKGYVGFYLSENQDTSGRARIQNTTDATTEGLSLSLSLRTPAIAGDAIEIETVIPVTATFVITGAKVFELQIISKNTQPETGVHDEMTAGVEVYATLEVWKIK